MKRKLLSIVLLLAFLLCFVGCLDDNNDVLEPTDGSVESESVSEQPPLGAKSVYDVLNSLSAQSYDKVMLDVTTLTEGMELNASYVLTATNVTYSVERLNLLPTDGTLEGTSSTYKRTLTGSATIEDGVVKALDGEAVTLPSYGELKGGFRFTESNFRNVQSEHGRFCADVISASDMLGTEKSLENLKITVEYSDSAFEKIIMTYHTTNSTVETVYEFE